LLLYNDLACSGCSGAGSKHAGLRVKAQVQYNRNRQQHLADLIFRDYTETWR
jgi:hypothetical protein